MEEPKLSDVYGQAIIDYFMGEESKIITYSSLGDKDEIPVAHLFRSYEKMPEIEKAALDITKGQVLDLGCGAGSHSLILQEKGHVVKSIDLSEGAIQICKKRGLKNAVAMNLWDLKSEKFDTILSLMNGAGICGSLGMLPSFMAHLKSLLNPDGQVLLDSSDIIYMFEDENGEVDLPEDGHYYGEVEFHFQYKKQKSKAFPWLYIDYDRLKYYAETSGFECKLIHVGEHYDYLAQLTLASEE